MAWPLHCPPTSIPHTSSSRAPDDGREEAKKMRKGSNPDAHTTTKCKKSSRDWEDLTGCLSSAAVFFKCLSLSFHTLSHLVPFWRNEYLIGVFFYHFSIMPAILLMEQYGFLH